MDNNSLLNDVKKIVFPKKGTWFYRLMHHKGPNLPKSYRWFKRLNKGFMVPLYRLRILPLFGIGWIILMITTIGRKSGKKRYTPLEFHRINGVVHITAGRGEKSDWVKNIRANPDKVYVRIGYKTFHTNVEFVDSIPEKIEYIKWMVTSIPREAKTGFGWDPKTDKIEKSDFTPLAEFLTVVRLHKPNSKAVKKI